MKYCISFLIGIMIINTLSLFGQSNNNKVVDTTSSSHTRIFNSDKNEITINLPDTLQLKNFTDNKTYESIVDKNMPWIVALLIGLLSVFVNFWIAHRLRQSNERNLQKQIDNNREITITQFKANIGTKNRQEWVNELRDTLSEYLTYIHNVTPDEELTDEDSKKYFEKIYLTKFKLDIMLNPAKAEQSNLIDAIDKLVKVVSMKKDEYCTDQIINARKQCIKSARELFQLHWNKIKELK